MSEQSGPSSAQPHGDQPGVHNTPDDEQGEGTVGLQDRTGPGTGAPAANQAKAEPMPPAPGHRDPAAPLEPPSLDEMTVGSADPQSPRHPAASGSDLAAATQVAAAPGELGGRGTAPAEQRPAPDAGVSTGRATGPENPVSTSRGSAHKAPGLTGETGPDEAVETDVVGSAARMGPSGTDAAPQPTDPGDSQGVPVPGTDAAQGTSEEHGAVRGARTPTTDR